MNLLSILSVILIVATTIAICFWKREKQVNQFFQTFPILSLFIIAVITLPVSCSTKPAPSQSTAVLTISVPDEQEKLENGCFVVKLYDPQVMQAIGPIESNALLTRGIKIFTAPGRLYADSERRRSFLELNVSFRRLREIGAKPSHTVVVPRQFVKQIGPSKCRTLSPVDLPTVEPVSANAESDTLSSGMESSRQVAARALIKDVSTFDAAKAFRKKLKTLGVRFVETDTYMAKLGSAMNVPTRPSAEPTQFASGLIGVAGLLAGFALTVAVVLLERRGSTDKIQALQDPYLYQTAVAVFFTACILGLISVGVSIAGASRPALEPQTAIVLAIGAAIFAWSAALTIYGMYLVLSGSGQAIEVSISYLTVWIAVIGSVLVSTLAVEGGLVMSADPEYWSALLGLVKGCVWGCGLGCALIGLWNCNQDVLQRIVRSSVRSTNEMNRRSAILLSKHRWGEQKLQIVACIVFCISLCGVLVVVYAWTAHLGEKQIKHGILSFLLVVLLAVGAKFNPMPHWMGVSRPTRYLLLTRRYLLFMVLLAGMGGSAVVWYGTSYTMGSATESGWRLLSESQIILLIIIMVHVANAALIVGILMIAPRPTEVRSLGNEGDLLLPVAVKKDAGLVLSFSIANLGSKDALFLMYKVVDGKEESKKEVLKLLNGGDCAVEDDLSVLAGWIVLYALVFADEAGSYPNYVLTEEQRIEEIAGGLAEEFSVAGPSKSSVYRWVWTKDDTRRLSFEEWFNDSESAEVAAFEAFKEGGVVTAIETERKVVWSAREEVIVVGCSLDRRELVSLQSLNCCLMRYDNETHSIQIGRPITFVADSEQRLALAKRHRVHPVMKRRPNAP